MTKRKRNKTIIQTKNEKKKGRRGNLGAYDSDLCRRAVGPSPSNYVKEEKGKKGRRRLAFLSHKCKIKIETQLKPSENGRKGGKEKGKIVYFQFMEERRRRSSIFHLYPNGKEKEKRGVRSGTRMEG